MVGVSWVREVGVKVGVVKVESAYFSYIIFFNSTYFQIFLLPPQIIYNKLHPK